MKSQQKNEHSAASQWADEVLDSLDGITRAPSNPWLYTRIMSRLEQPNGPWEKAATWISRPVFAVAAVALFLSVNIWVLVKDKEATRAEMALKAKQTEQLLAAEFNGASSYSLVEINEEK